MAYIGILGMVTFISIFYGGYQMVRNSAIKKEIKALKELQESK